MLRTTPSNFSINTHTASNSHRTALCRQNFNATRLPVNKPKPTLSSKKRRAFFLCDRHFIKHVMARFLLVLLTFSAVFVMLYQLADSSPANWKPDQSLRGARNLLHQVTKDRIADPPTQEKILPLSEDEADDHETETSATAEAPESRKIGQHHSSDRSVAGGGVIIGGLVTAIFAAVYCYIRVTRRKHNIQTST